MFEVIAKSKELRAKSKKVEVGKNCYIVKLLNYSLRSWSYTLLIEEKAKAEAKGRKF
jgi:hypothetical protein